MSQQQPDNKFYFMKTTRRVSKAGKAYHTGKYAYAIDLVGFEKEDGTISWWLSPKDMDQIKQQQETRQGGYQPRPQPQPQQQAKPQVKNYAPKQQEWDDGSPVDDLPF